MQTSERSVARMTQSKGGSAESRIRRRFTVPLSDEATHRWLDAQDSISVSIRLLIRDEIPRTGYTDRISGPVEQQPRRGRPPGSGAESDSSVGVAVDDEEGSRPQSSSPVAESVSTSPLRPGRPAASRTRPDPPRQPDRLEPSPTAGDDVDDDPLQALISG